MTRLDAFLWRAFNTAFANFPRIAAVIAACIALGCLEV
jgi:hypothetical protein